MEHWGNPDAVYDLPEEQRVLAVAEAMVRRDVPETERPLTVKGLNSWAFDTGLLKRKAGG